MAVYIDTRFRTPSAMTAFSALRVPDRDSYFRQWSLRTHYESPFERGLISSGKPNNPSS